MDPFSPTKENLFEEEIQEEIDFKKVRFLPGLNCRSLESVLPYRRGASTKLALGDAPLR
jgi:hypothetical protein